MSCGAGGRGIARPESRRHGSDCAEPACAGRRGDGRSRARPTPPSSTSANPAAPSNSLPKLPETEVVGEPNPASGPATPGGPGEPGEGHSILDGTIFSSPPAKGYDAESSTTGSLINVPVIDLPATVSIVPQAVIADQQVIDYR